MAKRTTARRVSGTRTRKPFLKVRLGVRCTAQFSPELERLFTQLHAAVEQPALLHAVVRAAVADTLLAAYRRRFLARMADMIRTERELGAVRGPSGTDPTVVAARDKLTRASEKLTDAALSGDADAVASARKAMTKAESALVKALSSGRGVATDTGRPPLATGKFRQLALQVLRAVTEVSQLGEQVTGSDVTIGIGPIAALEAIRTPSATPLLTGHATSSRHTTLWKHLEFGTGAYASSRFGGQPSPFRAPGGGWWYGPRPGFGLLLKGSKPGHFLFTAAGVPYDEDAMRFEQRLADKLADFFGE